MRDLFIPPEGATQETIEFLERLCSWWQVCRGYEDLDIRFSEGKLYAEWLAEEIHAAARR